MATGTGPCETPYIVNDGQRAWSVKRGVDGHRDYTIVHRIEIDRNVHGPRAVLDCPGLPAPGSTWDFEETIDDWAYFTQQADVVQVGRESGNCFFDITQYATTRPTPDCATDYRNDPLTFPPRIDIDTINYNKEAISDRFGAPIRTSSWEQIRGPQAEYDNHKIRVIIEANQGDLDLVLIDELMNTVNDMEMWGFPARYVKFSAFSAKKQFNTDCEIYWTKRFTFDISSEHDREILDEGTKVLRGKWDTDRSSATYGQYILAKNPFSGMVVSPTSPRNFIRFKDWHGENTRVILNGRGKPWDPNHDTPGTDDDSPGKLKYQYYSQGNLFILDIPTSLED